MSGAQGRDDRECAPPAVIVFGFGVLTRRPRGPDRLPGRIAHRYPRQPRSMNRLFPRPTRPTRATSRAAATGGAESSKRSGPRARGLTRCSSWKTAAPMIDRGGLEGLQGHDRREHTRRQTTSRSTSSRASSSPTSRTTSKRRSGWPPDAADPDDLGKKALGLYRGTMSWSRVTPENRSGCAKKVPRRAQRTASAPEKAKGSGWRNFTSIPRPKRRSWPAKRGIQ